MPYYKYNIKQKLDEILDKIEKNIYKNISALDVGIWVTKEPVTYENRFTGANRKIKVGDTWGELWDCAWFNFKGRIPEEAAGKDLVLLIDISGEGLVVDKNGDPLQGLTTVSAESDKTQGSPRKRVIECALLGLTDNLIDVWADAGCNDLNGKYKDSGTLKEAFIAECNEEMRLLYYDFEVLYKLMITLSEEKARYHSILYALDKASKVLMEYSEPEAVKAREILSRELDKKSGGASLTVSATGHAHIDLAWLWPIRETIRKGARTFSTVLVNMERYPDYVFGASQPQLYQWMKEHYPALYEKIKCRIEEGRWEVQGGMWVEADTNVSGGEALIRQILYGKRFFREEFGQDMKILWLPDVFGYNAALPQILKKSGMDYFMTIKLSWNEYNKLPHHTFWWQGLDGSKVLAHMPPEGNYVSPASPESVAAAEKEFIDKGISENCLLLFGIGDGGGGPGEEHLERLKREKDLNGLAPVVQEPALQFFKRIEKGSSHYKTWTGELYLETHQGTLTSQARNKRYNRKLEIALRELEIAASLAMVHTGMSYPAGELESIWKEMLLYQFHDILPGSSITRVYSESLERYEKLMEQVKQLTAMAHEHISSSIGTEHLQSPSGVFNSLSWERSEWVCIEGNWSRVKAAPMSFTVFEPDSRISFAIAASTDVDILESDIYKIIFNKDGTIKSIFDKENQREVIADNKAANRLTVYEDMGDAWDFSIQYDEKSGESPSLISNEVYLDGPKAVRVNTFEYGSSKFRQEIVLTEGSRRIDFITTADWCERNRMLRTSFPINVFATEASCEIQFGNIKRPTHRNTTWDMAKYEICAHKWIDLSQGDYGVALLNDCKYGHKVIDNIIDLNLLRSSYYPDPLADRAIHEFTYSLYPHKGDYIRGGVVKAGYELNMPLTVIPVKPGNKSAGIIDSFISVEAENVIIESVKKCEDDNDLIVRLYECHGAGVCAKVSFGFEIRDIRLVDLMEEKTNQTGFDKHTQTLTFRPFEIHTLKVSV